MMKFIAYVQRDMIRWTRAPLNIISTLVMPAAWLIFMGLVMPTRYDNYLDFVAPGILALTMLTAGLTAGTSLMSDKTLGYLNKFLALPSPRESILIAKVIFVTIRGIFQATVILIISVLIGATVGTFFVYLETYLVLVLFGITIASIGATVALYVKDQDTYTAFQAMISMPLYFASTALLPLEDMPGVLKIVASCNPLTYAIDAIRDITAGTFPATAILMLVILVTIMFSICAWRFRKVTVR